MPRRSRGAVTGRHVCGVNKRQADRDGGCALLRRERLGAFLLRPTQFLFWELKDGLGETTRLDIDRRITSWSVARLRAQASYGQSTAGVELDGSFFYFFALRERSAWELRMRVKAETAPRAVVTEYHPSLRCRWSMIRRWLVFEVETRARFRRKDDYDFAPEIIARVELIFGDVARSKPLRQLREKPS
jgi:hypothetical protein